MLRGITAAACDAGGLAAAKHGRRLVVRVRAVERYYAWCDDQGLPRAVLPEQDLVPWADALEALASQDLYERESGAERDAASKFVSALRPNRLEEFLLTLEPSRPATHPDDPLARLSPEKRALLLQRLRARSGK